MDTISYYVTRELDNSCNRQKNKFDIIKSEIGRIIPVHSMLGKLVKIKYREMCTSRQHRKGSDQCTQINSYNYIISGTR